MEAFYLRNKVKRQPQIAIKTTEELLLKYLPKNRFPAVYTYLT